MWRIIQIIAVTVEQLTTVYEALGTAASHESKICRYLFELRTGKEVPIDAGGKWNDQQVRRNYKLMAYIIHFRISSILGTVLRNQRSGFRKGISAMYLQ